jgi:hypothetical protein
MHGDRTDSGNLCRSTWKFERRLKVESLFNVSRRRRKRGSNGSHHRTVSCGSDSACISIFAESGCHACAFETRDDSQRLGMDGWNSQTFGKRAMPSSMWYSAVTATRKTWRFWFSTMALRESLRDWRASGSHLRVVDNGNASVDDWDRYRKA